ncbi:MAG: TIGR02452 family protein, partial [Lachnospiraceae bacterium]|nr:TIGR02452 family protein [Lachnospiraceae bacterium]
MMYKDLRKERVEIFEETKHLYGANKRLVDSINFSKQNQKVIAEDVQISIFTDKYNMPANVVVSRKRSLAAAGQYLDQNVCVLNFASATNAGGGVTRGSNAQEEAICRCSTLYACISDRRVVSQFHDKHRKGIKSGQISALYNDDCIYTPKVTVFRNDTDVPTLLPEKLWYEVDVISCAAPNLRSKPSNVMNPYSGNKAVNMKPSELLELHK